MSKANKYQRSITAMEAADWVLKELSERRKRGETARVRDLEHEAEQIFDVGQKYIQRARLLIKSGNEPLIWEVRDGRKDVTVARGEALTKATGNSALDPGPEGVYLIMSDLIENVGKIGWGKIGQRFDDHQRGNPGGQYLKYAWTFADGKTGRRVERSIAKSFPQAQGGGSEWIANVDPMWIYKTVVEAGGKAITLPPGFDTNGRRIKTPTT